ncbi:WXG100 family type VII secretion target [Phytomonospora endophytica]|uniref:ESAT-6-like protein n=1 Tax=Phytomonospora endophytica TaxID=714109 RepID=A0A841FJN7_9ACTN|nr:WXG100 family type VII secretion target [Phytomonospora endophytica]MBB6032849.1 WXG100 family type VII secretion target [Phytomonospora endophytica]GIG65075.1 hypothetical protein Pen01_13700 [Phytomonospora endophytica]
MPIAASVETINQAATDTNNTAESIQGKLTSLRNLMEGLAGSWQGAASAKFMQVMQAFDKEGNDMMTALGNIAEILKQSGANIQANEEESNSSFDKFGMI